MTNRKIFQQYRNDTSSAIEAKYVFELAESAAVCGFEAFIHDKRIPQISLPSPATCYRDSERDSCDFRYQFKYSPLSYANYFLFLRFWPRKFIFYLSFLHRHPLFLDPPVAVYGTY